MVQKIALVTGASSGIGKATAELFARNGYFVFAMARRMDRLEQLRSDQIEPICLDVTNANSLPACTNTHGDQSCSALQWMILASNAKASNTPNTSNQRQISARTTLRRVSRLER